MTSAESFIRNLLLNQGKFPTDVERKKEHIIEFIKQMEWPTLRECSTFFQANNSPNVHVMCPDAQGYNRTVSYGIDQSFVDDFMKAIRETDEIQVQENEMACTLSDRMIPQCTDAPFWPLVFGFVQQK